MIVSIKGIVIGMFIGLVLFSLGIAFGYALKAEQYVIDVTNINQQYNKMSKQIDKMEWYLGADKVEMPTVKGESK